MTDPRQVIQRLPRSFLDAARILGLSSACILPAEPAAAQLASHTIQTQPGDKVSDSFGWSVAGLGDVDGDGFDDLLVGSNPKHPPARAAGSRIRAGDPGRTGQPLHELHGDSLGDEFGKSVAGAGDVDADGIPDWIVGAPQRYLSQASGYARIFSGATGTVLWTLGGLSPRELFGEAVFGVGDLNQDGYDDAFVGAPFSDQVGVDTGSARVFSGEWLTKSSQGATPMTPSVLHAVHGIGLNFGATLTGGGDFDGDSVPDFAVGASGFNLTGYVRVYSGLDASVLWDSLTPTPGTTYGGALAVIDDLDGDARSELVVGARDDDSQGTNAGAAWVLSGSDGTPLGAVFGSAHDGLGWSLGACGDLDSDGYPDIAIGAVGGGGSNQGSVRFFSGEWIASTALGQVPVAPAVLQELTGVDPGDFFGNALGFLGDTNADGVGDLVVGANKATGTKSTGVAYVVSTAPLPAAATQHLVSLSVGGVQELELSAPATSSGDFYVLLGSASGQKPGIDLDGFPLPLNPDAYTTTTASLANLPPFVQFAGFLDANGKASARFELPPGMDPSLAGVTLDHAFVAIDWLPFPVVTFVSNAVPVTLVP